MIGNTAASMDAYFQAVSLYRRRNYDQCIEVCNLLLMQQKQQQQAGILMTTKNNNALHQGRAWELKMRAMTQRVYIDEIEADDGIAGNIKFCTVVNIIIIILWSFFCILLTLVFLTRIKIPFFCFYVTTVFTMKFML